MLFEVAVSAPISVNNIHSCSTPTANVTFCLCHIDPIITLGTTNTVILYNSSNTALLQDVMHSRFVLTEFVLLYQWL